MSSNKKLGLINAVLVSGAVALATGAAHADVVVVVSAKVPVENLTAEQISQIFLSKKQFRVKDTKDMIKPVDLPEGSALRDEFYNKVAGKDAQQLKAYWSSLVFSGTAQRPQVVQDSSSVKKTVVENPGQIGYIGKNDVDGSVKVVLNP